MMAQAEKDEDGSGGGGLVLLDVRAEEEFQRGHIPGASNVPIAELRGEVAAGFARRGGAVVVVVVGSNDTRSLQACVRLSSVYRVPRVSRAGFGLVSRSSSATSQPAALPSAVVIVVCCYCPCSRGCVSRWFAHRCYTTSRARLGSPAGKQTRVRLGRYE
jgi:rhodanese-related sulfurtransferase